MERTQATDTHTWIVEFRPLDDRVPTVVRIRNLLKLALRRCGLKASIVRAGSDGPDVAAAPAIQTVGDRSVENGQD